MLDLANFVEKIEELVDKSREVNLLELNGRTFVDKAVKEIAEEKADTVYLKNLKQVTSFIKTTVSHSQGLELPLLVTAEDATRVRVETSLNNTLDRNRIAVADAMVPDIIFEKFLAPEQFIIQLQTCFLQTEARDALMGVVSNMVQTNTVERQDDGVSQTLVVKKSNGVNSAVELTPIVRLKPIRTYFEVDQIESTYLLRADHDGRLALFEADGGMWRAEAQQRITEYLEKALEDEIVDGDVVVLG